MLWCSAVLKIIAVLIWRDLVRYRYYVIRLSPIQLITEICPSFLCFCLQSFFTWTSSAPLCGWGSGLGRSWCLLSNSQNSSNYLALSSSFQQISRSNARSCISASVVDPDPTVLGASGSGSFIILLESGFGSRPESRSFHQQAKQVRKTLISTILWLIFDLLSIKTDVKGPSKSDKQKKLWIKTYVW